MITGEKTTFSEYSLVTGTIHYALHSSVVKYFSVQFWTQFGNDDKCPQLQWFMIWWSASNLFSMIVVDSVV